MIRRSMKARAILLGPQRREPRVREAVEQLLGRKRRTNVALVTAGWEEREDEDGEFREHLGLPMENLAIWERIERIFDRDPELLGAVRERHDRLRSMQELYRVRLEGLVAGVVALSARTDSEDLVGPERAAALEMLRSLDREHAERVTQVHQEFDKRWRPRKRETIVTERREVEKLLDGADCLCIAGGHVGVLMHRLQLFGVLELWGNRPVVAWSAGAMVLTDNIVLFHQEEGQGARTEVKEAGFGLLPGIVPLPHASKRLDLSDKASMQLLAQRFAPAMCVPLDQGQQIVWDGRGWSGPEGTQQISEAGELAEVAR